MNERFAIYYAPEPGSDLDRFGQAWLRPPSGAPALPGFSREEQLDLTVPAAHYGFHATLKAPFRLADGLTHDMLDQALSAFAANCVPAHGARLVVRSVDGFLALVPEVPCPEINELAWDVVEHFDRFRARLRPEEIERRRTARLTPRQDEFLLRYGYPFVGHEYRFHMTLTRRLPDLVQRTDVADRLSPLLKAACREPLVIREVCLFVQTNERTPFRLLSSHALRGGAVTTDVYAERFLT